MRTTASRAWSNDLPNLSANCELSHTSLVGPLKTMTVVPVNICGLWDTESYAAASIAPEYASEARPTTTAKLWR